MGKKQRVVPVRPPTRKQLSRWERERYLQRVVVIAGAIIIALILAIPTLGYYRENVLRPQEAVLAVNGKVRTLDDYVRAMAYKDYMYAQLQAILQNQARSQGSDSEKAMAALANQQLQQLQWERLSLSMQSIEDMIDDALVRQEAAKLGIAVSADEIKKAIEDQVLPAPKPDEKVDQAKRAADFARTYEAILKGSGLSDAEYRLFVEGDLLQRKLNQHMSDQVPATAEQVHLLGILVAQEDEAKEVRDRLAAGEDFATLAKERSLDSFSKEQGGDLGWIPRGLRDPEFDEAAFALAPDQLSEPILSSSGYYVLKLVGKETREVESDQLEQLKSQALSKWLTDQRESNKIERHIDSDKQSWALDRLAKLRN